MWTVEPLKPIEAVMALSPVRRGIVALVAAYAVALQMLFAAASFALPADAYATLCSKDAGGSGQPVQHDVPCAAMCAAMGQGIAGPLPPTAMVGIERPQSIVATITARDWVPPAMIVSDSHAPRGPPLV
jgi:hypothetical protein